MAFDLFGDKCELSKKRVVPRLRARIETSRLKRWNSDPLERTNYLNMNQVGEIVDPLKKSPSLAHRNLPPSD